MDKPGPDFDAWMGHALGMRLRGVAFIQANPRCRIYQAETDAGPVIIKHYAGANPELARQECKSLELYHSLVSERAGMMTTRPLAFDPQEQLIAIQFIPGEMGNRCLRKSALSRRGRARGVQLMEELGRFLHDLYVATHVADAAVDPFHFEHLMYVSERLERLNVLGRRPFGNARQEADQLWQALRDESLSASFCHGDLVCRNMKIEGDRVGLIDFADTMDRSHLLNDLYNLRLSLFNLGVDPAFRRDLIAGLCRGVAKLEFPEAAHRFFYEFHRRRWLSLKLVAAGPRALAEGLLGAWAFVPPYSPAHRLNMA